MKNYLSGLIAGIAMYLSSVNVQAQTGKDLVDAMNKKLEIQTDTVVYSKTEGPTTIKVTKKSDTCYVYTKTTMIDGGAGGWDKREAIYKEGSGPEQDNQYT